MYVYARPQPLLTLLQSVETDVLSQSNFNYRWFNRRSNSKVIAESTFVNLQYYKVPPETRGLTKGTMVSQE
jgi:hypothetical protein